MRDSAYIALALCPGIGRVRLEALLEEFGTAAGVLSASWKDLVQLPEISKAAATAIRQRTPADGARVLEATDAAGGRVLRPTCDGFPQALREIPEPPTLLFVLGRIDVLDRPAVALIGSRDHSRYGADACRHLAAGLARAGLVVVSGMARGIDGLAHTAALDAGGASVGILGNGFGVVYPSANHALYDRMAQEGCLLTEHPPGERPHAGSFPRRNRLVSGLARVTVVIEARDRSGALNTVDSALRQGREVMAVPGPITSPTSMGCNRLIQQGAKPALGLRDVLEEYGKTVHDAPAADLPRDLTEAERRALMLFDAGDQHVDDVSRGLDCGAAEALAVLTSLEIRGLISQGAGKMFRRAGIVLA